MNWNRCIVDKLIQILEQLKSPSLSTLHPTLLGQRCAKVIGQDEPLILTVIVFHNDDGAQMLRKFQNPDGVNVPQDQVTLVDDCDCKCKEC